MEWRDVVSCDGIYIGLYEVSETGLVRCALRSRGHGRQPGRHLTQTSDFREGRDWPFTVTLYRDFKRYEISVHRLVAEAFIGLRPVELEINHIDGNKFNNYYKNLEYITGRENITHFVKNHSSHTLSFYGERMGIPEAIRRFGGAGISYTTVYSRIHRHGWTPEEAVSTPIQAVGRPYNS